MISPILISEVALPEPHPRAGTACPVFGFVIQHRTGAVLVDTGVGTGNPQIDALFAPVHHSIDEALQRLGMRRADVAMVVNSHLHFDHCGNNSLFPGVPLVVQRAEYEQAGRPGYTVPEWVDFPGAEWRLVDGEVEVTPGVRVVPTPGHTPGHQSVLVVGSGMEVVAGQAVYDLDELNAEKSLEPLGDDEAAATSASARHIKAFRPDRVHFSHDPRPWQPPAPVPS